MLLAISATGLTYYNSHPNNLVFLFNYTLTLSALDSSIFCRHSQRSNPGVLFEQCFNSAVWFLIKRNLIQRRKSLSWTNQTCNEVFRSCLAPVHLIQNCRALSQRGAAALNVCLTAGQSLKQTSRKQSQSVYNGVRVQAHQRQCFHHRGLLLKLGSEYFPPPRSRLFSIPSLKWSGRLRG